MKHLVTPNSFLCERKASAEMLSLEEIEERLVASLYLQRNCESLIAQHHVGQPAPQWLSMALHNAKMKVRQYELQSRALRHGY
jgi:hypothetical protein